MAWNRTGTPGGRQELEIDGTLVAVVQYSAEQRCWTVQVRIPDGRWATGTGQESLSRALEAAEQYAAKPEDIPPGLGSALRAGPY